MCKGWWLIHLLERKKGIQYCWWQSLCVFTEGSAKKRRKKVLTRMQHRHPSFSYRHYLLCEHTQWCPSLLIQSDDKEEEGDDVAEEEVHSRYSMPQNREIIVAFLSSICISSRFRCYPPRVQGISLNMVWAHTFEYDYMSALIAYCTFIVASIVPQLHVHYWSRFKWW